jgi:hypothetical protein
MIYFLDIPDNLQWIEIYDELFWNQQAVSGVMVSMLAFSSVDRLFRFRPSQVKPS